MKKIYALIVVITCFYVKGIAQNTYTWVGNGANNNWSTDANWSGPGTEPATGDIVIFNGNSAVNVTLDVASITLSALRVQGTTGNDVTITGTVGTYKIVVSNTTSALDIAASNILRLNNMELHFANNAKGSINGALYFEGTDNFNCGLLDLTATGLQLDVNNGASIVSKASNVSFFIGADNYLRFNSGSKLFLQEADPIVPTAYYHPASEIIVSGITTNSLGFDEDGGAIIGKLTYNCPNQSSDIISLQFKNGLQIGGDLNVENTNDRMLILMSGGASGFPNRTATISGNLIVSGTSKVTVTDGTNISAGELYTTVVNGSLFAGGTSFSLREGNFANPDAVTLVVKGNLQHTAGLFNISSNVIDESKHLYTLEMGGSGAQSITSTTGIFDSGTGQYTLKLNNASTSGVTLLSNISVGRIKFVDGVLNTGSNAVTVTNITNNSIVLDGPSANSYVNGNLRRTIEGTDEIIFAVGGAANYRPISVIPSSSTTSVYEASYSNTAYSDLSVQAPLSGVAPYYWIVNKISGADAKLRLTLNGAISGATEADKLIAVKFDGNDWISVKANMLNGTATSGNVETEVMSTFSPFTIGYALNSALPTHLVSFTAKKLNSSAQLNWRITENSTPETFEVLKSADGVHFSSAGKLPGFSGKLDYNYTDNSLLAGNNYYRLKMIDKDGVVTYSQIVVVMNGTRGVTISSMIPTMVVDRARLNISSSEKGNMQLVVTDMNGRIVHTQNTAINVGNQEVWLNATRISSGIFQITGYMNGEKTVTLRFFHR